MSDQVDRYDVEAMIRDASYDYAKDRDTAQQFTEVWEEMRALSEKVAGLERAFQSRTDHFV